MEPGLWELLERVQPKYRLKYVWEKTKGVFVCAETDPADEDNPMPVSGHNGCGHRQPLIRKDGLKLFTVDKKLGEDEETKNTKVRTPQTGGELIHFTKNSSPYLNVVRCLSGRSRKACNRQALLFRIRVLSFTQKDTAG
jgi:hypothetical protein